MYAAQVISKRYRKSYHVLVMTGQLHIIKRLISSLDWQNVNGDLCGAVLLRAVRADPIIQRRSDYSAMFGPSGRMRIMIRG